MTTSSFILTLACPDQVGIVAAVATFLAQRRGNILASAQCEERGTPEAPARFFMRVHFSMPETTLDRVHESFFDLARAFHMEWQLTSATARARVLVLVSKFGHCLNDLLYRCGSNQLRADILAVASNHTDFARLSSSYDVPFHHLPITSEGKAAQEAQLWDLIESLNIDTVVLARYMQILTPDMSKRLVGRAINIHHSFLPSFKGAHPYTQAYTRGVKLIGATAHYVTPDLDEGPIIEQDAVRVDHSMTPDDLMAAGRDVECSVLARALKYHVERRVLINGCKTVVFR
jgi:formyltetrahydrofolate deformylase